jgi:hypothetical protein
MALGAVAEVAALFGSAIVGGVAGAEITKRIDRRKAAVVQLHIRLRACQKIRGILDRWKTAIEDALDPDQPPEAIVQELGRLWRADHYERHIEDQLRLLRGDPVYSSLNEQAGIFRETAFDVKLREGRIYKAVAGEGLLARLYAHVRESSFGDSKSKADARQRYSDEVLVALAAAYRQIDEALRSAMDDLDHRIEQAT